jgi:hypothetical protein
MRATMHSGALAAILVAIGACSDGSAGDETRAARDTAAVVADAPQQSADTAASAQSSPGAIYETTSGAYRVSWTPRNISVARGAGAPFYSVRGAIDSAMAHGLPDSDDTTDPECTEEYDFRILSLVGSILTLEQRHYSYCEGLPHPSVFTGYHAIDLARTERDGVVENEGSEILGREIALTQVFAEEEVVRALLADRLVRKRLAENASQAEPTTADALVKQLEGGAECEYAFEPDMLRRWAIHHVAGDSVAVRIGLSHGCEAAQGKLTQIGIMLKIPAALRADLDAASRGTRGILMREAGKRFASAKTQVAYRYHVDDPSEGVD